MNFDIVFIMNKMLNKIGSIVFSIWLPIWTVQISACIVIATFINKSVAYKLANIWGIVGITSLEFLTGLKVEYKNRPGESVGKIYASEHQSTLEILALIAVIDRPIFVLKKSLTQIPVLGQCLKALGMVPVDRKSFNAGWMNKAQEQLKKGQNLIIFPEGTRVDYQKETPYRAGVFKLAQELNQEIIPVGIDTGKFWPRRAWMKQPGVTKIVFGKPLKVRDLETARSDFRKTVKSLVPR